MRRAVVAGRGGINGSWRLGMKAESTGRAGASQQSCPRGIQRVGRRARGRRTAKAEGFFQQKRCQSCAELRKGRRDWTAPAGCRGEKVRSGPGKVLLSSRRRWEGTLERATTGCSRYGCASFARGWGVGQTRAAASMDGRLSSSRGFEGRASVSQAARSQRGLAGAQHRSAGRRQQRGSSDAGGAVGDCFGGGWDGMGWETEH
ncbi:hypothetical protein BDV96DRAFT_604143 [Lophiotrema nucula]|uniref:Uncharacterized protein n=1 Tax=Lophiotrema nucula TaxID=690887 RepID=A0A6A5YSD3_9PLEO|nr:hypothetical protein BDV96DRAFT_604143 [Lophiotrema nucula]